MYIVYHNYYYKYVTSSSAGTLFSITDALSQRLLTKIIWLKPSDNRNIDTNNSSQILITVKNTTGHSPQKQKQRILHRMKTQIIESRIKMSMPLKSEAQ